ncbi:MAG: hypothetical protein IKC28_08230 [Clostridia bacterium]|nr:hypothetical protein [Clostridia bacterium]
MKRKDKQSRKTTAYLSEDQRKRALDKSTSYTTLLPHMDEGFHMGYRSVPGLQTDGSQKPHEWLESMAKNMQTPGLDVGFAIPDVLAAEQQLRRLSRLPNELAMRHQEMIDFRALLALLLLWEDMERTPGCPTLTIEPMSERSGNFAAMVLGAMTPVRARDGLQVAVLTRQDGEHNARYPLCLLSRQTILTPAADMDDLSQILPTPVRWYDRQHKRFLDPCAYLDEQQLSLLLPRLRLLMTLCEDSACQSPLYDPAARLCSPLNRFVDDLLATRQPWREKLLSGDSEAIFQLRTRVQAAYGLLNRTGDTCRIACHTQTPQDTDPRQNPLLRAYLPANAQLPAAQPQTFYTYNGVPFARLSSVCLLEPTGAEGEAEALAAIAKETHLLDRFDPEWRSHMAATLGQLHAQIQGRTGMMDKVPALIQEWQQIYQNATAPARQRITLTYPEDGQRMAAHALLREKLGIQEEEALREPLSDCLMLMEGATRSPFGDLQLTTACALPTGKGQPALYFLPPVSPALAKSLMTADPAPALPLEDLSAQWNEDGQSIDVSLRIHRQMPDGTSTAVILCRNYPLKPQPEKGAAFRFPAAQLPMVTVWPNIRLQGDVWKQYFVHTHQPGDVQVCALHEDQWIAGETRTAPDAAPSTQLRRWQTLSTGTFPAYLPIRLGSLSAGVLPNDLPARRIRRDSAAAVGLDFGSISTTVMLRQGDRIQPASLPGGLHGILISPDPAPLSALENELIAPSAMLYGSQREATFYSVMDLFSDDPEKWQRPLIDGHIYYPASLRTLYEKNEGTLYYDLKWSEESWVMACLRLMLKQVMLQASLSARLHGAPSISWRISTPNAMPPHRQEGYLNLMRGLAREVSHESGLPLTQGTPSVLYATENQAAGLYFRSRNEVNATGGYLNLDIGGGTADLSLWLNASGSAAAEASLLLGCRQMLFTSIAQGHIDDFEADFQKADPEVKAAAAALCQTMRKGVASSRSRQKCMLLMDDFFASYPEQIAKALEDERNHGSLCYTECLLLLGLGFLFYLCGVMLHRAGQDADLAPLLPARMELCIAGNGGQFLNTIGADSRNKLCQLALNVLKPGHPLRVLLPVQSREPKLEVASGLISDDGMLLSTLRSVEKWNATFPDMPVSQRPNLLRDYLLSFIKLFPQAAERLLGGLYHHKTADGSPALMPSAEMELATVYENEMHQQTDDDLTAAVRCMEAIRRMWEL